MTRKPKRNQEAYTRLMGFLPKQKELNNTKIEQDLRLGVTQKLDRTRKLKRKAKINYCWLKSLSLYCKDIRVGVFLISELGVLCVITVNTIIDREKRVKFRREITSTQKST